MKKCKDCGIEFVKTGRNHIRCTPCKLVEEARKQKEYTLKSAWKGLGITVEQYNELFAKQNGCCAICKKHQSLFKNRLAIDHCHTNLNVRGLLCHSCNVLLGHANDNPDVLLEAISYLKSSKE